MIEVCIHTDPEQENEVTHSRKKRDRCHPTSLKNESDMSNSVHLLEIILITESNTVCATDLEQEKDSQVGTPSRKRRREMSPDTPRKKSNVYSSVHLFAIYFRHQLCKILQLFM